MTFGLCITPAFIPTLDIQEELNPPYYRSILYKLSDIDTLLTTGRPLIITLNNQCEEVRGDWSGWDHTVFQICERLKTLNKTDQLLVLGAGNEFDLYWKDNQNDVPPEFGADLARRTARITHNYGIKTAATSVVSGRWPEYLRTMADLCRDDIDYFDIHPYGQRPTGFKPNLPSWLHGDLIDCIAQAQQLAQKPIICTEEGVKISDAGSEVDQGNFLLTATETLDDLGVPYKCFFAYHDLVGAPSERGPNAFGLVAENNRKRQAYFDMATLNETESNMPPVPPTEDWFNKVGRGLLDMMHEDGTTPAQRSSTWLPLGVTPSDIEECYGKNGTRYYWLLNEGKGFRAKPS